MSIPEFENWNPMADDFSCKKFNSYTDFTNPQIDPKSLYIRNVPADLSEDAFVSLFSDGGKRIRKYRLYPARPNQNTTCGIVSYDDESDALDAKVGLNNKSPLFLKVDYATPAGERKKNQPMDQRKTNINERGHGRQAAPEASSCSRPVTPGSSGFSHLTAIGRGRGQVSVPDALHSIKVRLEGDKRTTYQESESFENLKDTTHSGNLPDLIPNLCLVCQKKGDLSCGKCRQTYCSVNCQRQDWPKHKSVCKSLSTTILKQNQFANDSSYMSEGSSSDTDKRVSNISSSQPQGATCSSLKKIIRADDLQKQELSLNKPYKVTICKILSPSNFWIHLDGSETVLYQMEKELSQTVQKVSVKCAVEDVCCTFENGKFKRVKILEVTPNSAIVEFVDYGGTSTVLQNKLYFLPQVFIKYPTQSIGCSLVDSASEKNIIWNNDDTSQFVYHTKNKVFIGHVHGFSNNMCNIALVNEEGVSLYSILRASQMEELGAFPQANSSVTTIPSALSDLKVGARVIVGSAQFEDNLFWGYLDNGSRSQTLKELQNCLQKVETKDISLTCEEGDIAVGFSPKLNALYRCVVLKRLRNSFLVRLIDYGCTETITKLQACPMLLQKSYVICCEKPTSLTADEVKLTFEATHEVTVKSINKLAVEFSFNYKNKSVPMRCYPWYHGTAIAPLMMANSNVPSSKSVEPKKASQFPRKKISLSPMKQNSSSSEGAQKSVITKKIISDKKLDTTLKHDVKIVWIKDASKIYVQLNADEDAIRKLVLNLNKYCNSEPFKAYSPVLEEIVCCKFSDGVWYRAQVTGKQKNLYKVFFVDYGNEAEVSISDIKPLHEKFTCPKLSFCVSLYKMQNEDMNEELLNKLTSETLEMEIKSLEKTPAEVMLYLKGIPITKFGKKKSHLKTFLQLQELSAGVSEVVICYAQTDKIYVQQSKDLKSLLLLQEMINSLVKMDISKPEIGMVYCCLSGDGCWYRGFVKEILPKSVRVTYIDYGNDEEILIDNLKEISDELFSHPAYCVPLIVQNMKLSELKVEAVFSVEVVGKKGCIQLVKILNLPQNAEYPKISDLKRLTLQEEVNEVRLSFCENDVFYFHLKSNFLEVDTLCKKLMNPESKPLNQTPTEGDLVCAKSIDGCWYRASIQSTFGNDSKFKVLFIDYGNCEDVPSENVQCLPEDVLSFPVLCVPVKIRNIEKAKYFIDMNSVFSVKAVGFSDKVQLVEVVLPGKAILPKSNSLKKQSLPTDKEVDVSLCYVQGDISFVHLVSSKELLTTLETKLLKASEFNDLADLPVTGDLICAKFIDGIWYRGSVEKVFTDKKSCDICFIDYGNNEVISLENMKILPTSLCTFPVLSIPVNFKSMEKLKEKIQAGISVFPIRIIESSDAILTVDIVAPEDDIQPSSIESEILPESPVEVMIVHKEDDVFYVQKLSNAEKLQKMIIDLQSPSFLKKLLRHPKVGELCNVKYVDGQFYRAVIKEKCGESKFKAFFVDYGNLDVVGSENIYCIPFDYSSVPGLCIAVKFDESNSLDVLNSNPLCTIKYTGISNFNVRVVKLCPAIIRVLISSMERSNFDLGVEEVTFLSSEGEFHFLNKVSDFTEINEMNSVLKKCEENKISDIPRVDEVLVVKGQDNSRYRGCIKAVNEISKICKVFSIDNGTTEDVPFSDISYMSERLSAFPIFCIKVIIKDYAFMEDSILFGKQYSATVNGKNDDGVPIIDILKRYMLDSIIQQKLPLNELRNVVFFHKDGDILFLQDENDFSLVAEVQAEVKKHAASDPLSRNPVVGELLCARSQADGAWYRCCVEEIVSSDKCKIQFIDYGNDEIVTRENLRSFVGELAMYPSFAIPVRIIDTEHMKSTVQFEKVYSVIAESLENNVHLVKLIQRDSPIPSIFEDITLNDNSINSETKEICVKSTDIENSMLNEISTSTGTSSDVKFFYSTSEYVHFPDGEQDILIYSVNEECLLFCAPFNSDAIAANLGLTSEITQYCENLESSSFNRSSPPEVDELILAKYDADNQWYRAVILDDSNHPYYDVIFIDYGNTERVSIDFMRKMEKDFMSLPVQAIICSMTGFTIDDNSLPTINQELQSFTVFKNQSPLKAFVSSSGDEKSVDIPVITQHLLSKKLVTVSE